MTRATGGAAALVRARDAASRGAWTDAYAAFLAAQEAGGLEPEDLAGLAGAAYAAGHLDVAIETWERLHGELAGSGADDDAAAAAVRVAMHLLFGRCRVHRAEILRLRGDCAHASISCCSRATSCAPMYGVSWAGP